MPIRLLYGKIWDAEVFRLAPVIYNMGSKDAPLVSRFINTLGAYYPITITEVQMGAFLLTVVERYNLDELWAFPVLIDFWVKVNGYERDLERETILHDSLSQYPG